MKIVAPISDPDEVEMLVRSGAGELYCGLHPKGWPVALGPVNRRLPGRANLESSAALAQLVGRAHDLGATVSLALNAPHYEDVDGLVDLARSAVGAGVNALIVADVGLLLALAEAALDVELHLSSLGRGHNTEAVAFFADLGVRRVIVSRQTAVHEIARLASSAPAVSLEAFVLNDGCVFEEALCHTTHALGAFCFGDYKLEPIGHRPANLAAHLEDYDRWRWCLDNAGCTFGPKGLPNGPCGLCALPALQRAGVTAVKIAGREAHPYRKLRSVQMVAAMVRAMDEGITDGDLVERARMMRDTPDLCDSSFMCYYRRLPHRAMWPRR